MYNHEETPPLPPTPTHLVPVPVWSAGADGDEDEDDPGLGAAPGSLSSALAGVRRREGPPAAPGGGSVV